MLGWFRLLLALCVVASHTAGYDFQRYPDAGLIAVVAFFFVSGYLMPATFQAHYKQANYVQRSIRYLSNRFLRIFPPYWLALAFAMVIIAVTRSWNEYDINVSSLLQNIFLVGLNQERFWGSDIRFIGPAWTLDVEIQYYLAVPFLMFLFERRPQVLIWLSLGLIGVGLYFLARPLGFHDFDRSVIPWAPFFLCGLLVYYCRHRFSAIPFWIYAIVAACLIVYATVASLTVVQREWTLVAPVILVAAWLLTAPKSKGNKWDHLAGDMAYPVFIFHLPLIILFNKSLELGFWSALGLHFAASLAVAWAVHWGLVVRLERLRERNKDM